MVLESNRDLVLRRLLECLGRDRTKHQVAEVTSLGLVQMTRKRVGQGLLEVFSETVRALQRPRQSSTSRWARWSAGAGAQRRHRRERGGRRRRRQWSWRRAAATVAALASSPRPGSAVADRQDPAAAEVDEHGHIDHSDPAHDEHADHDADDEVEVEVGVEPGELQRRRERR